MPNAIQRVRVWVQFCVARCRAAWRVLRHGEAETSRVQTAPAIPVGRHRVTRERPLGTIIETLYQGSGAAAGQTYERYNAERSDEWICYYRRNERCGAKTRGEL